MRRVIFTLAIVGALVAVGAPLAAWQVDERYGVEVQMIAPHAPEVAEMERLLADETTPAVTLYGEPLGPPVRLVLTDQSRLIRPPEQPGLVLMPVDKQLGENPLQAKSVWFIAKWSCLGAGVFALVALGLWGVLLRRRHAVS